MTCSITSLCLCARVYASRGVVDGFGLLHELLADVMEDLVDAIAKHNQQDAVGSPVKGAAADLLQLQTLAVKTAKVTLCMLLDVYQSGD